MDDYGRDLCDAGQWGAIVASFGLESAEQVLAQGWRGVRIFTIDGYSNDMPMISVLSREGADGPSRDAVLEVRGPRADGSLRLRRDAWPRLQDRAAELQDLVFASPERPAARVRVEPVRQAGPGVDEEELITICLHAWVTVTESLSDTGVVRRIRNACGDDPLFEASYDFPTQALRGFPHCNHLDPANYRNESTQLYSCLILAGENPVAAAEVLNVIDLAERGNLFEDSAPDIRWLDPTGIVLLSREQVEPAFSERFGRSRLVVDIVVGQSDGVVLSGSLERQGGGVLEVTPVQQSWRRRGDTWVLVEIATETTRSTEVTDD